MTQQPSDDRVETEDRAWSPWNIGSLAAAFALFLLGVAGLMAVFPYSEPVGFNALFVTSPSVTPAARPAEAVKSATGEPGSPAAEAVVPDPTAEEFVAATEEPTEEAPPAVFAASQEQAPVATVSDLPDPTATPTEVPPTPEPTPVPTEVPATPEPEPTEEPTPEPTPTVEGDKPAPGEHPRSDPKKPVTAFIDETNTGAQSNERESGVTTPAQAVPPPPTN